jgi:mannan endo-1,4-beta-mannosidase
MKLESLESRTMLSAARPAGDTGTGFFVSGNGIYDANGAPFIPRGINMNEWWGSASNNLASLDQLKKTGANVVRLVFDYSDQYSGSITPASRQTIVQRAISDGLVPIVEDHDATGGTDAASLSAVVDNWLQPANVAWLKQYERYVILNIANEWGPNSTLWRDTYISQIARIRAAGVNCMIMIDAGDYGQDIRSIENYGAAVESGDSQHNVLFSIHPYGEWRTENLESQVGANGTPPFDVFTQFNKTKNTLDLPLVCGEFTSNSVSGVVYDTQRVMQICVQLGIGYLGWGWNNNNPSQLDMVPGTNWQYNSDADLTAWGNLIINDPSYGLKATAVQASIFKAFVAGDANMNGVVDSADFVQLAGNFGAPGATWSMGDFNGDGKINAMDFSMLATNFGKSAPAAPLSMSISARNLFANATTLSLSDLIA